MALALYRKYRPASFAEVVGQDHVTTPLINALASGRINHAYLFSGPRGCGKTSSARTLARSLNCAQGPTPTPCGVCDSCVALAPDGPGSLDVIEIDAASHGGVDDARDLRERAFFAPVSSRYKVYVVDEAHMVSTQGFNALLKLVEEPPEFLVFVFATTEPDKVLPTIRSRTHHYPFRLLPPGVMRGLLEKICAAEGVTVEPAVLPLVVRAGAGSARDCLSVLDQLLAGADAAGVTYSRAVGLLGVTDAALLDEMVDALAAGDGAAVFGTVDRIVEAGHDPRRFASDLLERFRDLVILDAIPDAAGKGIIDAPADQLERMVAQARRLGRSTLSRFGDVVHAGLLEMRGTTSPRLLLELLCARMLLPAASGELGAVLQRLERLERRAQISESAPAPTRADAAAAVAEQADQGAPSQSDKVPAADTTGAQPARRADTTEAASHTADTTEAPRQTADTTEAPRQTADTTEAPRQTADTTEAAPHAADIAVPASDATTAPPRRPVSGVDLGAARDAWPDVLERIKDQRRRTHALLASGAQVSGVDGSTLVIAAGSQPLARLLSERSNTELIRAVFADVLGVDWTVRIVAESGEDEADGGATGGPGSPPPGSPSRSSPPPGGLAAGFEEPAAPDDPRDTDTEPDIDPDRSAHDPHEAAMSLLRSTLGARQIDSGG